MCNHVAAALNSGDRESCSGKFHCMARAATSKIQYRAGARLVPLDNITHESRFSGIILIDVEKVVIPSVAFAKHAHPTISSRARAEISASSSVRPTPLGK